MFRLRYLGTGRLAVVDKYHNQSYQKAININNFSDPFRYLAAVQHASSHNSFYPPVL